ncbi:hypothetical protein QC763_400840 [Podospora pseudopauciseta]|uniref:Caib baif family enzyme n=1 Tax=Podospora pseudopauciseta TaxID=2093780 RepID=A0ABR0HBD0_9PEZI|nr:hypothetical protein QC763_400840 [Podospora pseudopauciseta]
MAVKDELRILTPIGMLGYSFDEHLYWTEIENGVDAIILDSGSTDSGPSRLALGLTSASREAYERDLKLLVTASANKHIPVLIGSAGGDGTNAHVQLLVDIVNEVVEREKYRQLKIVTIHSEITKSEVRASLGRGEITPCGGGVPELLSSDIDDAVVIVAQMGLEPWVQAMRDYPDFDIIIAGRSYDPAPYAAFCVHNGFPDLGLAHHMGKIMECGAVCATPKSAEALAIVRQDCFEIRPLNPVAKCTPLSVAAHTMYEKPRPDLLAGPGGILDVRDSTYTQLPDGRTIRVTGSKFIPFSPDQSSPEPSVSNTKYTIKLEAAKVTGHLAIFIGGIRDPIMQSQLNDLLVPMIKKRLHQVYTFDFDLSFKFYGQTPLIPGIAPQPAHFPTEIGVLGKVLAQTPAQAKAVANLAKVYFVHAPYPGQVATAGNFAMPLAPCDISVGPATQFCMYHLMEIDDPVVPFPISVQTVGRVLAPEEIQTNGTHPKEISPLEKLKSSRPLFPPSLVAPELTCFPKSALPSSVPLYKLAKTLRTKNAGPYSVTLDILFPTREVFELVVESGVLTRGGLAEMYGIGKEDITEFMFWEPALAFKATWPRRRVSGSWDDDDVHASGGHVGVMGIEVVVPAGFSLNGEAWL